MFRTNLTAARLRELLHYDPETGVFTNRVVRPRTVLGAVAGGHDSYGYITISVDVRRYLAHRLAWLYVYGEWPSKNLDHINGVRDDNRIANLREATQAQNLQNRAAASIGRSGVLGVGWDSSRKKWVASIKHQGKARHLGRFSTVEGAQAAYLAAKAQLHTFQPTTR